MLGKGARERVVPVGYQARRSLTRCTHKERRAPEPAGALFVGRGREWFTYNGLRLLLDRLADRAGLERMSPHQMRRGSARAFLRNGADVFSFQIERFAREWSGRRTRNGSVNRSLLLLASLANG